MSIETYLDHHIKLHTLRIELIDGKTLLYRISATVKEELANWMDNSVGELMGMHKVFLTFYSSSDRMVFIRISSIKRFIFCWDIIGQSEEIQKYHDNFLVAFKDDEELIIPEVIVKLKNCTEPLIYEGLNPHADFLGIDEESFTNTHFLEGGFLKVQDEDAEYNYIPITNIECIEAKRAFIYPDDMWQEMQENESNRSSDN